MPHHWNLCGYTECAAANPRSTRASAGRCGPVRPMPACVPKELRFPSPALPEARPTSRYGIGRELLSSPCRAAAVAALRISIHVDDRPVEVPDIAHDGRRPDPSRVSPNGLCVHAARGAATSGADARAGPRLTCRVLFAALHVSGAGRRSWALAMPLAPRSPSTVCAIPRHRTQHRRVRL
jgi:hypothetical protein